MTMQVCTECGSSRVFYDAYVGVNDPKDVLTFQATFCEVCGGPCSLRPATVWVLLGDEYDENGGWLYWSNEDGWGSRAAATEFSTEEMMAANEPQGAVGWQAVG